MKNMYYFTHDYNARTDDKIKTLIRKHGMNGYGLFWCIIEDLYNNANALRPDYDGIAYDLRTESALVKSIVNDFGLFKFDNEGCFFSESISRRLKKSTEISEQNRKNAIVRWKKEKHKKPDIQYNI